jgi:hypothetical protein
MLHVFKNQPTKLQKEVSKVQNFEKEIFFIYSYFDGFGVWFLRQIS